LRGGCKELCCRYVRRDADMMPAFLAEYKQHEAIEARLQALEQHGVRDIALERLGRGGFGERLGQVERALDHAERGERVVDPVPSRSEHMQAGEREASAPARDGYDKLHDDLAEREDALMARSVALEREKKALGVVAEPVLLARQISAEEYATREEAVQTAAFTVLETQRLHEAQRQQKSWNPFTSAQGERVESDLLALQAERYERMLEAGAERFAREGKPRLTEAFTRQSAERATWETRLSQITDEQGQVKRELNELSVARRELAALQSRPAPTLAREDVALESKDRKAALDDLELRAYAFAQFKGQQLCTLAEGKSVTGVLAWKDSIPGSTETLVLIDDGKGTLHQRLVDDVGAFQRGNRVTLALSWDARATLSRGPERDRGMRR
jgi:hypothetical protein